jgi:hypothetical protein
MRSRWALLLTGALAFAVCAASGPEEPPPVPEGEKVDAPPEGVEVQARGPVHEAFAEPTEARADPGPVVPKAPPDPVEEVPPEEKPEGDNVVWVPGYWAWDQEKNDFLWVSGFWRAAPPGRQWVPGHWQAVEGGSQWVPGYWSEPAREEVEYLPPPPPSIDAGPSTPPPEETSTYVPGCWVFQETRFLWRPGYWVGYRPGWVWIPACYKWTPAGYLFVAGFWDHALEDRGTLFAPVFFDRRVLARRFVFRPRYVVQTDFLIGALFVRPRTRHFFFGDYFDRRFVKAGFVPWVDFRVGRSAYDANFAYYRHAFAKHPAWERGLRALYASRFSGTVARPPHTLVQQTKVIRNITINKTTNVIVNKNVHITNVQNVTALTPVTKISKMHVTALHTLAGPAAAKSPVINRQVRIEKVPKARLIQEQKAIQHYRAVAKERHEVQSKLIAKPLPKAAPPAPRRVKIPAIRTAPPHIVKTTVKPPPPPVRPKAMHTPPPPPKKRVEPPPKKGVEPPPKKGVEPPPKKGVEPPPKKGKPPPKPPAPPPPKPKPPEAPLRPGAG